MRISLILISILFVFASNSMLGEEANKGLEIAIESDKRSNGFIDSSAKMRMILTNRHGESSSRELRVRAMEVENDGDKSMTIFDTPADVKGTALLTFSHKRKNDDQWLYLPALAKIKRMSSSNKSGPFMGSEFAFEDLGSQEVEKYTWSFLGEEELDGVATYRVQRVPLDKKSGYTKQIVWIHKTEYYAIKIDFYDRKKSLLKTLNNSKFQLHNDRFWRALFMVMENHQTGKRTDLIWSDIVFGNGYKVRDFAKNSLKRIK
ncbi:MAG: outer membrane lipoprotein-sorting protein [Gammaproteobacteria bacterium]|nr:MAG: outer membrane lipoprotein-sorting protein [Gammaproteobacteria bacterium]